ncbi:MAG: type I-U CRISPR-associated protein Cas8c [Rhodospirillaceae bacterium]|nr:type I-U CRISPR-associated protein Cas8c [Rhodospirillaceae bacterium]MYB13622.1 type I-U CRISPR-associated protein Cas8c [Rhodospirillaceae bacterium]MYI50120.1 type I-U CRISPR-associated protein Cas8c [Rhodospirillaceae bacterium]
MMAEASIPVDLTNPGQVFACLGFLEAADVLLGEARGSFDWRNSADLRFRLAACGSDDPVVRILRFLDEATVTSVAPVGSAHSTGKWKIETGKDASGAFPFRDTGPDVLPARLSDGSSNSIAIDHWGNSDGAGRDRVKFWAGAGGYPGAGLARDALDLIRGRAVDHACDPFSLSAEQSSSFRFDWRRDYVPIDAGFSPNAHDDMVMRGYPIVELLAAIGLTNARPVRRHRLEYSYGVAGMADDELYDPIFLRAALGAEKPPFPGMPFRLFAMRLDWPGQEGQARCITDVIEETPPS